MKLRRTTIFIPGTMDLGQIREMIASCGADLICLDLEDTVIPSRKGEARDMIVRLLHEDIWGRAARAVRINAVSTPHAEDDIKVVVGGAGARLDTILLSKPENVEEIHWIDRLIEELRAEHGFTNQIGYIVGVESAYVLTNIDAFASCSPNVEALGFAIGDLSASLGVHIAAYLQDRSLYPGDMFHFHRARMLHEGLGSISMWRDFPEQLAIAAGHPVMAWSRQGYGHSDPLSAPRDPDYMHREAEMVPLVMDAFEVDHAVLFGHSDGGSIALIAAAWFPQRVAGLILEAPHVYVEQLTVDSIAQAKTVYDTTDLSRKLGRHHQDADHVFRHWNAIWLDPRFRDWNIEPLLPAIRVPALLIQGHGDEYGTMDQLDRIEARLARIQRVELKCCGHSPHRDRPEAVIEASAAFLEEYLS